MPKPNKGESHDDFIPRCMSDDESIESFPDESQRLAVCESSWINKFATQKISFDYDDVLTMKKGFDKAQSLSKNSLIFIITARSSKILMKRKAERLGIPMSRVLAMGSNKEKVKQILKLKINTHYDNNPDVIKELGKIGKLFK